MHFWDSLGQIFQNWPYFWVFEWKKRLKFLPRNYFFFQANTGFWNFYTTIYEYLQPDLKNWYQDLLNQLKKMLSCRFYQHVTFCFWIWNLQFLNLPKTTFAWSGLEQVSSGLINSNFFVGKVTIWRCRTILSFSGLHFIFHMTPSLNFQQGLFQPPVEQKWPKRITVQ